MMNEQQFAAFRQEIREGQEGANKLLAEMIALMKRTPYDGIQEAEKRAMGQVHSFAIQAGVTEDVPIDAAWLRVSTTLTTKVWRTIAGDAAQIWINESPNPIIFPFLPHLLGTAEASSTGYEESVGRAMVFEMPIYKLRVENRLTTGNIVLQYCHTGRITEEIFAPRDTMESYLALIREAVEATQAAVETGGDSELRLAAIEAACVAIQAAIEPMELTMNHDNPNAQNIVDVTT